MVVAMARILISMVDLLVSSMVALPVSTVVMEQPAASEAVDSSMEAIRAVNMVASLIDMDPADSVDSRTDMDPAAVSTRASSADLMDNSLDVTSTVINLRGPLEDATRTVTVSSVDRMLTVSVDSEDPTDPTLDLLDSMDATLPVDANRPMSVRIAMSVVAATGKCIFEATVLLFFHSHSLWHR